MITISCCMIVKNEEKVLARCLDSIADLMDEIVIVDTGSTDGTKAVAARYTDKIYDFEWNGSFADARNYSFSKATAQYIYCADADEVLDRVNHDKFALLKKGLLPEIDIVQMYYCNQMEFNTIYNFDRELRPKLYKRVRTFTWYNPIHETVGLQPTIYDSEIEIIHKPTGFHASRDLEAFEKMYADGLYMDNRLHTLYAKELLIAGEKSNLHKAIPYFEKSLTDENRTTDSLMESYVILARAYRSKNDVTKFFKYAMRAVTLDGDGCAEICLELASFYHSIRDFDEERIWANAALSLPCVLNIETTENAKKMLAALG
ncbi:MAG: glycosyltransferase family 2 protein [Lachnospiraceae bacterium]|nr:glycosyltransferase family 2 protein [Lachnospiraceae bacterium]